MSVLVIRDLTKKRGYQWRRFMASETAARRLRIEKNFSVQEARHGLDRNGMMPRDGAFIVRDRAAAERACRVLNGHTP